MRHLSLAFAILAVACSDASADRITVEANGQRWTSRDGLQLQATQARRALGVDIAAYCLARVDESTGMTVLRAGDTFYALNGLARSHFSGGIVLWKGSRYPILDRRGQQDIDIAIGSSVVEGNDSCR